MATLERDRPVLPPPLSTHDIELLRTAQRCIMESLDHSRAAEIVLTTEQGDSPHLRAWPSLRSQNSAYVVQRLQGYRAGTLRDSSNDFIIQGVAGTLDDASIEAVAAYVASLR